MKFNLNWKNILPAAVGVLVVVVMSFMMTQIFSANRSQPEPGKLDFLTFQQDLNQNPMPVKSVSYSINNPTMLVEMKDGKDYNVDSPMTPDFRLTLLQKGVHLTLEKPIDTTSSSSKWFTALGSLIPMVLIVVVMWMFIKNQRGQTKLATNFVEPGSIKVRMKDVAGVDHAREELEEIITFLRAPGRFTKVGAKMPKGVLLSGPPGTGKTLLGKAIAGEAGVPFVALSGSDFVEKYVGVGASRVRELFEGARKKAPCIVFIDEIDALGKERGTGGSNEYDHALNQLLVEMNGFTDRTGIVVIAATNRADSLDKALLRPGRFDRHITVGLPDKEARLQILEVHANKRSISVEARRQLSSWARRTTFFSGADLENLLNEAAIRAVRNHHEEIQPGDMEEAYNRVVAGGEKRGQRQERDTQVTAWHEAGHAILGAYHKREVPRVTIVPTNNGAGGYTLVNQEERMQTKQEMMEELQMLLGGRLAEELQFGPDAITGGASADFKRATQIATTMVANYGMSDTLGLISISGWPYKETPDGLQAGVSAILNRAYQDAKKVLTEQKHKLDELAVALLEKETLVEDELVPFLTFDEEVRAAA